MQMKKRLLAIFVAGTMAVSLFGCGGSNTSAGNGDGSNSHRISVILKTTAAEYWRYVIAGAKAYEKEHDNLQVDVKGATSETAYDEQLNMIETDLANERYDAYVIAPLQADMIANLIRGQTKPVLAVDTNIDAPEILSFIGTGNEDAAALGGKAAVEAARAAGWQDIKCIEIAGVQGDLTNTARMKGYMRGVEEAGGDFLEKNVQYANAVADQAVTCMEAIMQTHPEGIAIICANNDDMAMAAARAAKNNSAYANTVFVGFNGDRSACVSILEGELTLSVAQNAYEMGYLAVEAAVKAIEGETLEKFIDSGAEIINSDNAQTRLDMLDGYLS